MPFEKRQNRWIVLASAGYAARAASLRRLPRRQQECSAQQRQPDSGPCGSSYVRARSAITCLSGSTQARVEEVPALHTTVAWLPSGRGAPRSHRAPGMWRMETSRAEVVSRS